MGVKRTTNTNRLRVEGLRFFGLGPCSLTIAPGECVGLTGPSGAGKTRLLRAIADLDPHEGTLCLGGVDSGRIAAPLWRRQVALLLTESRWWRDQVGDHFTSVNDTWLKALGFDEDILSFPVHRLSSGEKQRLSLIRMIGNTPRVLLLDEPTASLDAANTRRVETLLDQYREKTKAAVLWISHDPDQLTRMATRRFVMDAGKLKKMEAEWVSSP